jgi:anti-sigma B factor antagonist
VLAVRGEVDMSTGSLLQRVLLARLRDAPQVKFDLTAVSFLSAAGLTVVVNVKKAAAAAGSSLCLVAGTRVVLRPLTITGLSREFDIYPKLADTLADPGGGPDG